MTETDPKLKRQRVFIAIFVILALLFAAGNIIASLGVWQEADVSQPSTVPAVKPPIAAP